jgi:hypothetical protein
MTACQDWGKRRVEMMTEDTKHILDDAQNLMQMSAQLSQRHGKGNVQAQTANATRLA